MALIGARLALVLCLVVGVVFVPANASPVSAGEDVCPEPNNEFQNACNLGTGSDALGFISAPDDNDVYRIVAQDSDARVRVELSDRPFPYRLVLANWNGETMAVSEAGGALDATLGPPGTYYVSVDSPTGQSSDGQPYRIGVGFTYPSASVPRVVRGAEFREAEADGVVASTDTADHVRSGGRYTIAMKVPGTAQEPRAATTGQGIDRARLADFAMVVDVRITAGDRGGYGVYFRRLGPDDYYSLTIDARNGQAILSKRVGGQYAPITQWTRSPAINTSGGVNRTTIQAIGSEIRIHVNGQQVIQASDSDLLSAGDITYGVITWGEPTTTNFDNLLVTAPPAVPGATLAADEFSNAATGILSTASTDPSRWTYSYTDGEYIIRKLFDEAGATSSVIPYIYGDASIAIDARLTGDTAGRYVSLACRRQVKASPEEGDSEYRLAVDVGTGAAWITRWTNGEQARLTEPRRHPSIRSGNETNRVELTCAGSTISARVNGEEVVSAQDATYVNGALKFGTGTFAGRSGTLEARFDNLVVTQR